MQRDILFLLKESFADGPGMQYYCPHCAEISGVLAYFPKLRHNLDVRYVEFPRPRDEIVKILGNEYQNCPVLVLADKPPLDALGLVSGEVNGKYFISGPLEIGRYWSHVHGISRPH
jgi:hypothetical protein